MKRHINKILTIIGVFILMAEMTRKKSTADADTVKEGE